MTSGNPVKANSPTTIGLTVSNPSSNQFTVTGFTINAPSTWTISGCTDGSFLDCSGSSASSATWTVSVFFVGTGAGIPPGGSDSFTFTATPSTATSYPYSSVFSSKVQDASSVAFYNGATFSVMVMDPTTTIAVTPTTNANYAAGSAPLTVTATVTPAQAGLPIVFSASYTPATASSSYTPKSATTNSLGVATSSFQPSNHAGDMGVIKATVGTSAVTNTGATITTVAGSPSSVTFGSPFSATHYLTASGLPSSGTGNVMATVAGSTITFSVADKFGNPVSFASLSGLTVTISAVASGGLFDAGAGTHPTSVTCTAGINCGTGTITYPYFQSGTYGSAGLLTASATGTVTATTASFAAAGSSGSIVTSAFDAAANAPTFKASSVISVTATCGGAGSTPCQYAGKSITIFYNTTITQQGVPVTLYIDYLTNSSDYAGTFSNNAQAMTVATGAKGGLAATFKVDTLAGAFAQFYANYTRPTDANANAFVTGSDSSLITTIAGQASTIKVKVYFTNTGGVLTNAVGTDSVAGLTLWVNAIFSDAYGNAAANPGPNAVQVTLSASGGLLSATTVYIPTGGSSTLASFGAIAWTLPSSGSSVSLTASGVVNGTSVTGTKSITLVSKSPSIFVTAPAPSSGVIYVNTLGVVFNGNASTSLGYPPTVTIASVKFSVDSGAAQSATIVTGSGTGQVTWSAGVFFSAGLHNITFTGTDSIGNTVTTGSMKVVADTSAPKVAFTTKTGANLTYGSTATATIVDTLGDLNASSVTATRNGTAVAAANIAVAGTNVLGTNTTYTVTLSNLPSGTWVLALSASDLAGNSGSATSITVHVTVPFAASVIINSATSGTLGSFSGISVSATNVWSSSQSLVVFAVWKNSVGQTVAVTTGGLTLASGATGTAFAPLAGALPSGSYTVNVFVVTTGNNPVSSTTTISVNV